MEEKGQIHKIWFKILKQNELRLNESIEKTLLAKGIAMVAKCENSILHS